jgi:uncharacterized membrane protein YphA (DoxX/SURF4 family)
MDSWPLFLIAARSRGLTTTALRGQPMVDNRRSMMTNTMHRLMQWVFHPPTDAAPPATLLIRLMAGGVFVGEGLLKFVFPATLGVGRFHALGIPAPELMATFVGLVEIVGGLLFLLGWFTRLAAIPLMIDIVVAILSTKIPLWLGTSPLPLPPVPPQVGVWAVVHEIRSDVAQLLCSGFLLLMGAGPWSLDAFLARTRARGHSSVETEMVVR